MPWPLATSLLNLTRGSYAMWSSSCRVRAHFSCKAWDIIQRDCDTWNWEMIIDCSLPATTRLHSILGGFSPLSGFMQEGDYKSVVNDLKLSNGLIFGLPVVFDTDDERVVPGAKVLLQYKNVPIAVFDVRLHFFRQQHRLPPTWSEYFLRLPSATVSLHSDTLSSHSLHNKSHTHTLSYPPTLTHAHLQVSSRYVPNKALEAKKCYGTTSIEHPAVSMITTGKNRTEQMMTSLNAIFREDWFISRELRR